MSYTCRSCGIALAGMETCDCPEGQAAYKEFRQRFISTVPDDKFYPFSDNDVWNLCRAIAIEVAQGNSDAAVRLARQLERQAFPFPK